jgi:hypothetical protein
MKVSLMFVSIVMTSNPQGCSLITHVVSQSGYEKSLCYVKSEQSNYRANQICMSHGMTLFDPKSTDIALETVSNFATTTFNGNPKAQVHVLGRSGNRCSTMIGNGELKEAWCHSSFKFFCEFVMDTSKLNDL